MKLKKKVKPVNMPMNFLKFNKMFFFQNYVFNYMIKKK